MGRPPTGWCMLATRSPAGRLAGQIPSYRHPEPGRERRDRLRAEGSLTLLNTSHDEIKDPSTRGPRSGSPGRDDGVGESVVCSGRLWPRNGRRGIRRRGATDLSFADEVAKKRNALAPLRGPCDDRRR